MLFSKTIVTINAYMCALICSIVEWITGEPCFTIPKNVDQNADPVRFTHYNDYSDTNDNFGPRDEDGAIQWVYSDEYIDGIVKRMWAEHGITVTRREVEEYLSSTPNHEEHKYNESHPTPIFIERSRNDYIVAGKHQQRSQTASLASQKTSRQKIC